jgi:very-short-patch-repair endonuclease
MTVEREAIERAVTSVAGSQHTIITAAQLAECGLGRRAIAYRLATRYMRVVFRGVYSIGCGELPPLAREHAALLASGEAAFISHHSAAFVWGLLKTAPEVVEVSLCGRSRGSRDGLHVHRIKSIDRRELRRWDGLWVSSPARAVLEIAGTGSADELANVIDEGLARRLLQRSDLQAVLARNRPCRGAARLATLIADAGAMAVTRSKAEKRFLKLIRAARLPLPETNARLGRYEPDFMWSRERLVVEIDGYNFHSGPDAFRRDREKALALREHGLDVLRFTPDHVFEQPEMVLARVAQELARRAGAV